MINDYYQIRCSLPGHSSDVRAVSCFIQDSNHILSASRDKFAKLWVSGTGEKSTFTESTTFVGHSGFVASICFSPPTEEFPHGLVFTGSNDKTIHAYLPSSPNPLFVLKGHQDTVCALQASSHGLLVSASWDKTARLWKDKNCKIVFKGHEAAVWSVLLIEDKDEVPAGGGHQKLVVTGSADRTIRIWDCNGQHLLTLSGHGDCVRDLARVPNSRQFLSCSNDASIRRWSLDGQCLMEYYGHTNFIYSVAALPDGEWFTSSGEDRSVRLWRVEHSECIQTIAQPCQSVWSVIALPNGDLVSGGDDGVVRVFSRNPDRQGDHAVRQAFESELSVSTLSAAQVDSVDKDKLPGTEALDKEGTKEGEVLMVNEDGRANCYQWSVAGMRWIKIGEVVGSSHTASKPLYEGKEYDYVFSVDIEEGAPPLKLPYNRSEDPWLAAQNFIYRNDLSQVFLDRIANFIVENSGDGVGGSAVGIGAQSSDSDFVDPFTGAGRYVPLPMASAGSHANSVAPAPTTIVATESYFPKEGFIKLDTITLDSLLGKLREFNTCPSALPESALQLIKNVNHLSADVAVQLTNQIVTFLPQWPVDKVFPLLDLLRHLVCRPEVNSAFFTTTSPQQQRPLDIVLALSIPQTGGSSVIPVANSLLALRLLANGLAEEPGRKLILTEGLPLLHVVHKVDLRKKKGHQVAAATLLLNWSVALNTLTTALSPRVIEEQVSSLLNTALLQLAAVRDCDPEAAFRLLVTIGTVLATHSAVRRTMSQEARETVLHYAGLNEPIKLLECAQQLLSLL